MSILPRCTCDRFGSGFGEYSDDCPRHWSSANWLRKTLEKQAADEAAKLEALRKAALTRPIHGGYPDSPKV